MPVVSGSCEVFSVGRSTGARDGTVVSGSIATVARIMPGSVAAAGWRFVVRLDALCNLLSILRDLLGMDIELSVKPCIPFSCKAKLFFHARRAKRL